MTKPFLFMVSTLSKLGFVMWSDQAYQHL